MILRIAAQMFQSIFLAVRGLEALRADRDSLADGAELGTTLEPHMTSSNTSRTCRTDKKYASGSARCQRTIKCDLLFNNNTMMVVGASHTSIVSGRE